MSQYEPTTRSPRVPRMILFTAASFSVILGLSALLGWWLDIAPLVSVRAGFPRMQPHAALAFVLSGVGLLACALGSTRAAAWCAAFPFVLSELTLIQRFSGHELGVDHLLFHVNDPTLPHPGRIALNTAMCFVLVSVALFLTQYLRRWRFATAVIGVAGSAIAALGGVALIGYLSGIRGPEGLGQLTRMAVHGAAGFTILGIGIIALGWSVEQAERGSTPRWTWIVVGFAGATATLWLWQALLLEDRLHRSRYGGPVSWIPSATLAIGLLFTALLAVTVVLAQRARLRAAEAEGARRELEVQIEERQIAEKAVQESEAKFRDLFDNAPIGYHELDSDGRIIRVNQTELTMLGYRPEEMIGHRVWNFVTEKGPPDAISAILQGVRPGGTVERTYVRKDGALLPVVLMVSPMRDPRGKISGLRAIVQDITEQRRLENQLRQSQKMEAIGRLAGGIAHDFNNLLTVIIGHGDLLMKRLESDPRRKDVEDIRKAADRAASLTNQLLAFSRKQVLQPRVLDLNAVVAETDKMLRRLIGEDIELRTLPGPGLGRVRADPDQLAQVIMNLAVNARDAMPNGGHLTIETRNVELDEAYARRHVAVVPGRYVLLSVSDTGVGMDPETQARVFEPFFTTKEQGKGTGLGLSTVYGIVKQSGGNIWVYSELGYGSAFKIYLPRVDEDTQGLRAGAMRIELPRGSETILLVEDEEWVRDLVRQVLQSHGYTVLPAGSADEAMRRVAELSGPLHLLLTDVVIPGRSGRQLAEQLRTLRPTTRILFMSGYTDEAIIRHGVLEPGSAFLQKPFTPEVLACKVREVLDAPING